MIAFLSYFKSHITFINIFISILLIILLYFLFNIHIVKKIVVFAIRRFIPEKYKNDVKESIINFYICLKNISVSNISLAVFISLLSWLIYFIQAYFIALSIGINISFFYLSAVMSIVSIIVLIPVTFYGLGTREIVIITLMSKIGIASEMAVSFSLVLILSQVIMTGICFIGWWAKPIKVGPK
jgi:uncharacterized protein (TIRG00374 family)